MIITVSHLIFYREPGETGISGDWPSCTWLGTCDSENAEIHKIDCYEASVDFLRWPLFHVSQHHPHEKAKVIYTDLWRFTKQGLFNQVQYNTDLIKLGD